MNGISNMLLNNNFIQIQLFLSFLPNYLKKKTFEIMKYNSNMSEVFLESKCMTFLDFCIIIMISFLNN